MGAIRLNSTAKRMIEIITEEGAFIKDIRNQSKHLRVDYTFDGVHVFTQSVSYGSVPLSRTNERNFRAQIRRKKTALNP